MAVISSTVHSVIDYVAGIGLLLTPWALGLPSSTATVVLQVVGAATIATSLVTDYRLSVAKLLPFRLHLLLDVALGVVMLLTGWLASEGGVAQVLLIVTGIIYVVVPALSWPRNSR